MNSSESALASPCTGVCRMDEATGLCLGCARTLDEITDWRTAPQAFRDNVRAALPKRFARLGLTCLRLPWEPGHIRDFVAERLAAGQGTWVAGVVGAVAEFTPMPGEAVEVVVAGQVVTARTCGGDLRFIIDECSRALSFTAAPGEPDRLVLGVLRERGQPPRSDVLTDLGPDRNAINPAQRNERLYDLGLNRVEARFCFRLPPGAAQRAVEASLGSPFPASLARIGAALLSEVPVRVIETALGRIEVATPIPPPDGASPLGPHTHLLPAHLTTGRATPVDIDTPRAYLPGAIFYPAV